MVAFETSVHDRRRHVRRNSPCANVEASYQRLHQPSHLAAQNRLSLE
jgi:hypothetical protein